MDDQKQETKWQLVGETPGGYGLYRKPNGAGGYWYTTDECPTGWIMYDSTTGPMEILYAIAEDHRQQLKEYHERKRAEREQANAQRTVENCEASSPDVHL